MSATPPPPPPPSPPIEQFATNWKTRLRTIFLGSPDDPRPPWRRKRVWAWVFVALILLTPAFGEQPVEDVAVQTESAGSETSDEDTAETTTEQSTTTTEATTTTIEATTTSAEATTSTADATTTEATTTTLRYSPGCERDVKAAANVSALQDTWPDLWPAFSSCQTAGAFVQALSDHDPDDRWTVFTEQQYLNIGAVYVCEQAEWPDGPYETIVCKELLAQLQ